MSSHSHTAGTGPAGGSTQLTARGWPTPAPLLAVILGSFLAASTAPTPLYRIYQAQWHFSPVMLTAAFGVYALTLMAALLTVGKLSDHVGRKPLILASLTLECAAMAMFIRADDLGWLIAARAVQGFATGAGTSALGAALLDALRARGAVINSVAPIAGMAAGALTTSLLVQYGPAPLRLIYGLLLAVFVLQIALMSRAPETVSPQPGAWAALRPRLDVPLQARGALLASIPAVLAVWAIGGFYLSLGPSLARVVAHSEAPMVGGLVVFAMTASSVLAILHSQQISAAQASRRGALGLLAGVSLTLLGVHTGSIALFGLGAIASGYGFGATFQGAARSVLPLAQPHQRAGLLATFYVICYLSMCLPALLAGALAQTLGLVTMTDIYGAAVLALASVVMVLQGSRPGPEAALQAAPCVSATAASAVSSRKVSDSSR